MIKAYFACLSSYNHGFLFGEWLDLDDYKDKDNLLEAIEKNILKNPKNPSRVKYGENPEEWAMHDIEGIDYDYIKTEYPDLDKLMEMNDLLNDDNGEMILKVMSHFGFNSIEEAKNFHDENYQGEFKSWEDFAYYIAEEVNGWDLSSGIGRYFDAESFGRDLSFDYVDIDGHIYLHA